jgi:hypothetical protein
MHVRAKLDHGERRSYDAWEAISAFFSAHAVNCELRFHTVSAYLQDIDILAIVCSYTGCDREDSERP